MADLLSRTSTPAPGSEHPHHSRTVPLMGGTAHIVVVGGTEAMLDRAVALADRCEARWSRFLPTSDVSRLNVARGATVDVDPLTVTLIEAMTEAVTITDGDFAPTLLPWLIAAGYGASVTAPDLVTELPQDSVAGGDIRAVVINGLSVRLPPHVTVDAGGIGKGLAADLVVAALIDDGAAGALAEISGDVVVAGDAPDGVAWRLAVEDPFRPDAIRGLVRMASGALVTSSQRKRRFTTERGERHHLIDPRTGDSVVTDVQTVSVIAGSGARAEALAKSGFLRPVRAFLDWMPHVGAAALIIDGDGVAHASANWADYT